MVMMMMVVMVMMMLLMARLAKGFDAHGRPPQHVFGAAAWYRITISTAFSTSGVHYRRRHRLMVAVTARIFRRFRLTGSKQKTLIQGTFVLLQHRHSGSGRGLLIDVH
uniref:Putative secreted peptide n=1 Tax=Anopheles braziliensis TaxID=58242 RepID=A0A2M3ZN74_9DIPT